VRRDRNHPSIVVYSAGNEIHDTQAGDRETDSRILVAAFHAEDSIGVWAVSTNVSRFTIMAWLTSSM
jgi:beta-galactosidase/beta-glucuronidase